MNNPLVSILIPVYGVEAYIEKCILSIINQSYENIEIIVINDKSPDKSIDLLSKIITRYPVRQRQLKIINHEINKGLSGARNTGIDWANGKYILHLDADDYLDSDAVAKLVYIAEKNDADMVFFDMRHIYKDRTFEVHDKIAENKKDIIRQLLTYQINVGVCGKLIKTSIYRNYNIRAFEGINYGEDYAVTPRLAYHSQRIIHLNKALYNYVHYNPSSYTESYKSKNIDDLMHIIDLHKDFFLDKADYSSFVYEAMLNVKIKILIAIAIHSKEVGSRLSEISSLYRKEQTKYLHTLSLPYKVLLGLSNLNNLFLLSLYVKTSLIIKKVIKRSNS